MEFIKGFIVNGVFIGEGSQIKITTVQGIVVESTLASSAKKKLGIQLSGELETRVFELVSIAELVEVEDEE